MFSPLSAHINATCRRTDTGTIICNGTSFVEGFRNLRPFGIDRLAVAMSDFTTLHFDAPLRNIIIS
jgi:hypothetical protein